MTLTLTSSVTAIGPDLTASFLAIGGTAPYIYSVVFGPNAAGGSINSSTGVYSSPLIINQNASQSYDTILVTDSTSTTSSLQILVGTPLLLVCDILQNQMNLQQGRVFLWDQKIFLPKDNDIYIVVGIVSSRPFGNTNRFDGATHTTIQSINMLDLISLDIISRGPAARDRKADMLIALNSNYAESQQELNSFFIGKLPSGSQFINLSDVDGSAIPYRFRIQVALQYFVTKVQSVSYYNEFSSVEITTEA